MTTNFENWQAERETEKHFLAEVTLDQHLIDWTKTSGQTNVYELDIAEIPKLNHLPQFASVKENGTAYSSQTSIANVDSNAGSYYYDQANSKVYIHTSGSDDPDGKTDSKYDYTILARFTLYFTSGAGEVHSNNFYYPRMAQGALSNLSVTTRDIYFGTQTTGKGDLRMKNEDGFFDAVLSRYVWRGAEVKILLGGEDLAYADYATVFRGFVDRWQGGDTEVALTVRDYRSLLRRKFPINTFTFDDYPNMDPAIQGKGIPIGYGEIEGAECFLIDDTVGDGKYKLADHPVAVISTIYNNGSSISDSYITKDTANGEFTISGSWSGTPDQITADFQGIPGSSVMMMDTFSDDTMTGQTTHNEGGTATYTEEDGVSKIATPDSVSGYVIYDGKEFANGTIEVKVNVKSVINGSSGAAILWDWVSTTNHWKLEIRQDRGKIQLRDIGGSGLLGEELVTLNTDTEYTLKLEVSSAGVIKGYLDDVLKITYDAGSAFSLNPFGYGNYVGSTVWYDDYTVEVGFLTNGADMVKDIFTRFFDVDSADIDTASFANAADNAWQKIAVWSGGTREEASKVLDRIAHSNLCRLVVGADGKIYYRFWDDGDTAVATVKEEDILGSYQATQEEEDIYDQIDLYWGKNAGSQESVKSYSDPQVKELYKRDETLEIKTFLEVEDEAEDMAFRYYNLVREPITRYALRTKLNAIDLKVGDLISVERRRGISPTGLHNGNYRIFGIKKDFSRWEVELELVSASDALRTSLCSTGCQETCESDCQGWCLTHCEGNCELVCQLACQFQCQQNCQLSCETCAENPCQEVSCQLSCTTSCELGTSCETRCEIACEPPACIRLCETTCELVCQGDNQTSDV